MQPEWEAKKDSVFSLKILNFFNCVKSHMSAIVDFSGSYRKIQLVSLDLHRCDCKNISNKRVFRLISIDSTFTEYSKLLLDLYLFKIIKYVGLEWHIYTNMSSKKIHYNLCLLKKKQSWLLLCRNKYFDKIIESVSNFLFLVSISLKNIKCNIYKYVKYIVYLDDINCIIRGSNKCFTAPSKRSIRELVQDIKQKLYHKNKQGFWRINSIRKLQRVPTVKKMLSRWSLYYSNVLSKAGVLQISQTVDYILYKWQVK